MLKLSIILSKKFFWGQNVNSWRVENPRNWRLYTIVTKRHNSKSADESSKKYFFVKIYIRNFHLELSKLLHSGMRIWKSPQRRSGSFAYHMSITCRYVTCVSDFSCQILLSKFALWYHIEKSDMHVTSMWHPCDKQRTRLIFVF